MGKCSKCGKRIEYNAFVVIDGKVYCPACVVEKAKEANVISEEDLEVIKATKEAEELFHREMTHVLDGDPPSCTCRKCRPDLYKGEPKIKVASEDEISSALDAMDESFKEDEIADGKPTKIAEEDKPEARPDEIKKAKEEEKKAKKPKQNVGFLTREEKLKKKPKRTKKKSTVPKLYGGNE